MRLLVLCFAGMMLAGLNATAARAQYLPDLENPDAPLNLWQEDIVARIRDEERPLFSRTASFARLSRKPLSEWTQRDLARFRQHYDISAGEFGASAADLEAFETGYFFESLMRDSGGGDD